MNDSGIYLSVIIPAYNEEDRIQKTLEAVASYLEGQPYSYEVIVVSDGSTDNTAQVVKHMIQSQPYLRFIDREENRGKGFTVKEGMFAARGEICLFTDSDNSTDISYFDKMKPLFEQGSDVVISTRNKRDAEGAGQKVSQAWYKRIIGKIGNLFIQVVAVPGIWDTQNGFKAFRDSAAEKIFIQTKVHRWAFDVEVLGLAKRFHHKISVIPILWRNDPKSHIKLSSYFGFFFDVLRIRWYLLSKKYKLD